MPLCLTELRSCSTGHAGVNSPEIEARWHRGRGSQALPDDEDALGQLPSPLPERVAVVVSVERAMLCREEGGTG